MKSVCLCVFVFVFSFKNYAQTEKIFHRSHSGSNKTFAIRGDGNWGNPRMSEEDQKRRDSVLRRRTDSLERKTRLYSIKKRSSAPGSAKAAIAKKPGTKS